MMTSDDYDLKVIHLIRDPRAVARSRLSIHAEMSADEVAKNVTNMCNLQMASHSKYATDENYYYILYEVSLKLHFLSYLLYRIQIEHHLKRPMKC